MSEFGEQLKIHRDNLINQLDQGTDSIRSRWIIFEALLNCWWKAYKKWEENDKFDKAFKHRRMTVRTFPGGYDAFTKQVSKEFKSISLADSDRFTTEVRIFKDSQYTPLSSSEMAQHDPIFHKSDEAKNYHAKRGIDSSAFADPANFATRDKKYEAGLHDLSASLLNPKLSIFDQIHNTDSGFDSGGTRIKPNFKRQQSEGAHFSFLPLSREEDQQVLYRLIQCAKELRLMLPALYDKVRGYRAEMTRVKLANEFDMGIGYSAVPVASPAKGSPAYKLRYGLGFNTTIIGQTGQQSVQVTAKILAERQKAALKFKSILGIRDGKNEIVIAIRKHAGPFPVYAVRDGNELLCYDIGANGYKLNGKKISANGVMTG